MDTVQPGSQSTGGRQKYVRRPYGGSVPLGPSRQPWLRCCVSPLSLSLWSLLIQRALGVIPFSPLASSPLPLPLPPRLSSSTRLLLLVNLPPLCTLQHTTTTTITSTQPISSPHVDSSPRKSPATTIIFFSSSTNSQRRRFSSPYLALLPSNLPFFLRLVYLSKCVAFEGWPSFI